MNVMEMSDRVRVGYDVTNTQYLKYVLVPTIKRTHRKTSKCVRNDVHNNNHVKVEPIQFWYVVKIKKKKTRKETMIKVVYAKVEIYNFGLHAWIYLIFEWYEDN